MKKKFRHLLSLFLLIPLLFLTSCDLSNLPFTFMPTETTTISTEHVHNCSIENPLPQYLKQGATCSSKAIYYKSCSCGSRSSETFEFGEYAQHKVTKVSATASTTTTQGIREHYECSVCHKLFTDQIATNEVTLDELKLPYLTYVDVSELTATNNNQTVTVRGMYTVNTSDGTTKFLIKSLKNGTSYVMVKSSNLSFKLQDKNGSTLTIGNVIEVKGTYSSSDGTLLTTNADISKISTTAENISYTYLTTSMENVSTNLGSATRYKAFRFIPEDSNPLGFGLYSGDSESGTYALCAGNFFNSEKLKVNGRYLTITAKSISLNTGISAQNIYSSLFNFSSSNLTNIKLGNDINYFYGEMYFILYETTDTEYKLAIMKYDSWNKTYENTTQRLTALFKAYNQKINSWGLNTSIYTFESGKGINDISNYLNIPEMYENQFEIQKGKLCFVGESGTDLYNIATLAELTITTKLNLKYLAIINEAWAYYYQGNQIQYDQTIKRRELNVSAEKATAEDTLYLDCSSYVNNVYYSVLGSVIFPDVTYSTPNTDNFNYYGNYYTTQTSNPLRYGIVRHEVVDDNTYLLEETIRGELQIGDLINYRHDGKGHVMIYLGDDTVLHCTGNSYSFDNDPTLSYDLSNNVEYNDGAVQILSLDDILTSTGANSSKRFILSSGIAETFTIIRPLSNYRHENDVLQEQAINRLSIPNISLELSASVSIYNSVNRNQEITYTLKLQNHNGFKISYIDVIADVPDGTTYVYSSNSGSYENGKITWSNISVAGNSIKTLTFKVSVNSDTESGKNIIVSATANGVKFNTLQNQVTSLKSSDYTNIKTNAEYYINSSYSSSMEYINDIYERCGYDIPLLEYSAQTILDSTYYTSLLSSSDDTYHNYLVTDMWGGYCTNNTESQYDTDRIRYVFSKCLNTGDIIITYDSNLSPTYNAYIYVNGFIYGVVDGTSTKITTSSGSYMAYHSYSISTPTLYHTQTQLFLEQLIAYDRFIIIRPGVAF